jgi:hypothetical protein
MKDIKFALFFILLFAPFFIFPSVFDFYMNFNIEHGLIMSFIKFAILATLGEVIGLRIRTGKYFKKGFGILPRALVWGLLGLTLKAAFDIFASGTPVFLEKTGMENASLIITGDISFKKLVVAFSISVAINIFYAPVLMTVHKITDIHIVNTGGSIKRFFTPMNVQTIIQKIDWKMHWGFILKRTIPLFWIPAQTITFLLPSEFRVLFAAFLGIVLGVLLAVASLKSK